MFNFKAPPEGGIINQKYLATLYVRCKDFLSAGRNAGTRISAMNGPGKVYVD